jgi:formylglycine-generating enzyme required for sulfatase activity
MSYSRTVLAFCIVVSLIFVAGYLASDRNAATDKTPDQNATTNKAPDRNATTNKAPDQTATTNKAPDQNIATTKAPDKYLTLNLGRKVTMKFALLPAGEFMMGSKLSAEEVVKRFAPEGSSGIIKVTAGDFTDEHPRRQVTISAPFYMGVTEVTQAQWKAMKGSPPWNGQSYTRDKPDDAASYISWNDATAFCKALSKKTGRTVRLPTEAEWEYACRAGTTTAFSCGDDSSKLGDYAQYRGNTYAKKEKYAHSVGAKKPNAWGLYDMHGNVYEWCADWYVESYANADARGPKGPATGKERVARGGSWRSVPAHCRAARRTRFTPGSRLSTCGFRVVVESGPGVD